MVISIKSTDFLLSARYARVLLWPRLTLNNGLPSEVTPNKISYGEDISQPGAEAAKSKQSQHSLSEYENNISGKQHILKVASVLHKIILSVLQFILLKDELTEWCG
jgi:hypothetical protein